MSGGDGQTKADLDEVLGAGSRWDVMTEDLNPGPAPHPGSDLTDPTVLATLAIHGTVQLTTQQLQELLSDYAGKNKQTATAMGAQEGMSASSLKDIISVVTSIPKDISSSIAPFISAAGGVLSSGASSASSAVSSITSGIKPAMDGVGKTSAPGGTVAAGLTAPDNINHQDATTNNQEGERDGHDKQISHATR